MFEAAKEMAQTEFDDLEDVEEVERCTQFMALIPVLRRLMTDVPQRLLGMMKRGITVEGYKPVASIGYRTWNADEDEVATTLWERGVPDTDLYTRKLKTPPQLEKLGHKKAIEGLTYRPIRGYTVAAASDKRPAADISMAEFDATTPDEETDE